jgi:Protein kinase domain
VIASVASSVGGLLLGAFGMAGLVRAARSGPPGARGLALSLGAGLASGVGVGLWMWQLGLLSAAVAGILAVAVAGLVVGLLVWLAGQSRLFDRPSGQRRVPGYQVESVLGTGADTVVYLARQIGSDRLVRLKRLRGTSPPRHVAIAARLGHPNIAQVHAFFEDGGRAYLTGEHVDGASLRRVVEHAGPLRPEQALEAVCDALEGLAYAHARGLRHGGLTPENLIVDHHGVSKLVDFGQRGPAAPKDDIMAAADLLEALFRGRPPADVAAVIRQARMDGPAAASAEEFLCAVEEAASACCGDDWRTRGSLASLVLVTVSDTDARGAPAAGEPRAAAAPAAWTGSVLESAAALGRESVRGLAAAVSRARSGLAGLRDALGKPPALAFRPRPWPQLRWPGQPSGPTLAVGMIAGVVLLLVAVAAALAHSQGLELRISAPSGAARQAAAPPASHPPASLYE